MEQPDNGEPNFTRVKVANVEFGNFGAKALLDIEPSQELQADLQNWEINDAEFTDDDGEEDRPSVYNDKLYAGQPFAEIEADMTPITADRGVLKKVLKHGSGPCPGKADTVVFEYRAHFDGEVNPYDSTFLRTRPEKLLSGDRSLIRGVALALEGMRAGEKVWVLIKPQYAYKSLGAVPRIPKNATILYDISLNEIIREEVIASMADKDPVDGGDRYSMNIAGEAVRRILIDGNSLYNREDYRGSLKKYRQALWYLDHVHLQNDQEEEEYNKLYLRGLLNTALTNLKLKEPGRCITECKQALQRNRRSAKALYLWGKALLMFCSYDEAERKVKAALKIMPANNDMNELLKEIKVKREEALKVEKNMARAMLGIEQTATVSKNATVPDAFKKMVETQLQEFANKATDELNLSLDLLPCHVDFIKEVSHRLNMTLYQTKRYDPEEVLITIRKNSP